MPDDITGRIDAWLAENADPGADPFPGMAEAGLFAPAGSYTAIGRMKAALVERTGLLGIAGAWGGRQLVGRWFIETFGNAEQRGRWLGRAASVAISEPKVGAHPKHLRTRADAIGDHYHIFGEKAWVSNGLNAEVIVVLAITDETDGRKRYSAFLVPRETFGLSMQEMPGFHALRPSRHCALTLHDCRVPRTALLGEPGKAYERMAMPFRDVEDTVGLFGTLGAVRFLLPRLPAGDGDAALSRGGLVALCAVFTTAANALVSALDADRLHEEAATLVGLRVLAIDMMQRIRNYIDNFGPSRDPAVETMLSDLEVTMSIARGPRLARQSRLGYHGNMSIGLTQRA